METSEQRIKIAVQKAGRLTDHSLDLLERCGLKFTQSKEQLFCYGENMPVDLLLVRDDDIPGLVSDDVCDLGIAGGNIIEEKPLRSAAVSSVQVIISKLIPSSFIPAFFPRVARATSLHQRS